LVSIVIIRIPDLLQGSLSPSPEVHRRRRFMVDPHNRRTMPITRTEIAVCVIVMTYRQKSWRQSISVTARKSRTMTLNLPVMDSPPTHRFKPALTLRFNDASNEDSQISGHNYTIRLNFVKYGISLHLYTALPYIILQSPTSHLEQHHAQVLHHL
jgi:hypothetical protein